MSDMTLDAALILRGIRHEATNHCAGKRRLFGPNGTELGLFDAAEAWERIIPAYPEVVKIERLFASSDRYAFDFGLCTYEKGWAQLDTFGDASYFGNWVNPAERKLVCYCEGDVNITTCETDEAFTAEVRRVCEFWSKGDGRRAGIDPGFSPEMKAAFERFGLGEWLH
jgi:hypothetical protein